MSTEEEFADALREAVAEMSAVYYRVSLPGRDPDPVKRVLVGIIAGWLDGLPGGDGGDVLRRLGEAAVRDGG